MMFFMSHVKSALMYLIYIVIFAAVAYLIYKHLFLPTMSTQGAPITDAELAQWQQENEARQKQKEADAAQAKAAESQQKAADAQQKAADEQAAIAHEKSASVESSDAAHQKESEKVAAATQPPVESELATTE
jgi:preprotein translocase subunit SecF